MVTAIYRFLIRTFIVKIWRLGSVFVLAGALIAGIEVRAAEAVVPATQPQVLSPRVAALRAMAELPDPFIADDGQRLINPKQWPLRRQELRQAVLKYEYGSPPPTSEVAIEMVSTHPATQPAITGATVMELLLKTGPDQQLKTRLILTIPSASAPHGPKFPVIVRGDLCWGHVDPHIAEAVIERGYMLAEFDRTMVAADKAGRGNGIYLAYPEFDGGDLVAWAWTFSRVIDYLVTRPDVDAKCIVVTGLSRGGKAALLAGALDERVAVTVPASSGCGGCAAYRVQPPKSEDIAAITKRFPYWFEPHFPEFIGYVERLPIDQHEVKALVAPRALLETAGLADQWANLPGSEAAYLGAREVYKFLGVEQKIGIAWRPGKHEQNLIDWTALLDFADRQLFGKAPGRSFDTLAFPEQPPAFSWKAP
jgi:hypothetical protein